MDQRTHHALASELLEVGARFADPYDALAHDLPHPKPPADQFVHADGAGEDVAAALGRIEADAGLPLQPLQLLGLDERDLPAPIRKWAVGVVSGALQVPVTRQSPPCDGLRLRQKSHRLPRERSRVDGLDRAHDLSRGLRPPAHRYSSFTLLDECCKIFGPRVYSLDGSAPARRRLTRAHRPIILLAFRKIVYKKATMRVVRKEKTWGSFATRSYPQPARILS